MSDSYPIFPRPQISNPARETPHTHAGIVTPAGQGVPAPTEKLTHTVMDALLDGERIRGGTRMFPEGTDATTVTEEDLKLVAHNVRTFAKDNGIAQGQVAREIGYKKSTISEVLAGTYQGKWQQIVLDLDAWLEASKKRLENPLERPFVWTSVAKEIAVVAKMAVRLRAITAAYGEDTAGLGKTMCAQALHKEMPGSGLLICDMVNANTTGLLRGIAGALGIGTGYRNDHLMTTIVDELRTTPRLLIIDQVHSLLTKTDVPLFNLTDIWNKTNSPQLWLGTNDMVEACKKIKARGLNENMSQVRTRIKYMRNLTARTIPENQGGRGEPLFTIEDIRKVFARDKIRISPEGLQMLHRMACIPDGGGLRTVCGLVDVAAITAEARDLKQIDIPLLLAALEDSSQPQTFISTIRHLKADGIPLPKRLLAFA